VTPQHARSLSPEQLDAHRQKIAFDVKVFMANGGYWDAREGDEIDAAALAEWADRLEDWHQPQIIYALRKFQDGNPSKRPNPGHILAILKETRGKAEIRRNPLPKLPAQTVTRVAPDADMKARADAIMAGFNTGKVL
jgi:hypothetical protein